MHTVIGQIQGTVARLLLAILATTMLGGCATRERAAAPELSPEARRASLQSLATWEARGRIALDMPAASGQGSFAWSQSGDQTVLRVAGPFGAGGYEIHWDPERLRVLSNRGDVAVDYAGPGSAERFLTEQLGWSLPVANARYWLLGLAGPDSPAVEAVEAGDGAERLAGLTQDGWQVRYGEYRRQRGLDLPRKLVLESAAGRIRLVIDQWQF
ncbi:MAG: lipoprotein insertase outer membrane protein LolB [Gammaproteobacteria bacterium]